MKSYKNRKPVIAINVENPSIELIFESVSEAARELQANRQSIGKCIAGDSRYTIVKGYIFRALDYNGDIIQNEINIEERINKYKKGR